MTKVNLRKPSKLAERDERDEARLFWLFAPLADIAARRDAAIRRAFRSVRRDVWNEREARLVAKWESYG